MIQDALRDVQRAAERLRLLLLEEMESMPEEYDAEYTLWFHDKFGMDPDFSEVLMEERCPFDDPANPYSPTDSGIVASGCADSGRIPEAAGVS